MRHQPIDFGPFDPPQTNLVEQLAWWAKMRAGDMAFKFLPEGDDEEITITYGELDRRASQIAARLLAVYAPGDRALLLYPPGLDFICGLMGCLYAGIVAVPAYPPRRNRNMLRIQAIADDARAQVVLTTEETAARAQVLAEEAPRLRQLNWMATDDLDAGDLTYTPGPIADSDLAMLQYTSGSTGMPKGVMLTHANLINNLSVSCEAFAPASRRVVVSWLPLFHDMGLVGGVLYPIYIGRPCILMPPMAFLSRPIRWLKAIQQHGGNISGGPCFAYQLCVDRITEAECEGLDLSSWELALNGAEPVRADTLEAFTEKFAPYGFRATSHYPCYGMAESTLMITGGPQGQSTQWLNVESKPLSHRQVVPSDEESTGTRKLVACGEILCDYEMAIVDADTRRVLPNDRVGEIWIRGASVAEGYWYQPDASSHTFDARLADSGKGHFLRTGDLGFLHEGQLYITGRLKDLIILRGTNYYPQDIEQTVQAAHPRLTTGDAAAFSVNVRGSERLVVVAEVERRRGMEPEEVIESIRRTVVAGHDISPEAIVLVRLGTVPKTSSGKIQRHACRESFLDGSLRVVSQWRSWRETAAVQDWSAWQDAYDMAADALGHDPKAVAGVLQCVQTIAADRAAGLTLDSNIVDLGLDSLERVEIVAALEGHFGGRFPSDIMTEVETCREVVEAVERYLLHRTKRVPTPADIEVPAEHADPRQFPEVVGLASQLGQFDVPNNGQLSINPFFHTHEAADGATTKIDGREVVNFSSYNYLGLAGDDEVIAAAQDAVAQYGASASASRLVSGERPLHRQLERTLADLVGAEDALTFVGGHATNESTIGHLLGPGDLILYDARAHNSIIQGARLSGARRRPFPHNDWAALDEILADLRPEYRRVLIALEGVYSMDGDVPPLPEFVEVKKRHRALLLVDEAHSIGVLGKTGRGIGEHFGVAATDVDLWMGTLSKALGSCGGYIAGCRELVQYLRYTAPGFVYSVGMSPANTAAALAAVEKMLEEPSRIARLQGNSATFRELLSAAGLPNHGEPTPVFPYITGSVDSAVTLSHQLLAAGFNIRPIVPPAVEENAARLRFFITAEHDAEHLEAAVGTLAGLLDSGDGTLANGHAQSQAAARVLSTEY